MWMISILKARFWQLRKRRAQIVMHDIGSDDGGFAFNDLET